ncbi:pyridoxal-phosphate dependent enzyme [Streptomyces sp. NPDC005263]|uniref:pyridoxal-phosphate dependent enzyme n=1 Tax=Streptomyces sp. NPDC005263 TaxID=3364711 RepID=UPI0036930438
MLSCTRSAKSVRVSRPSCCSSAGIHSSSLHAIGGTPLVRLRRVVPDGAAEVRVKVEGGNPTGSYKDRMALAIIEGAERRGRLVPGQRVVEFTGGSTGSSLAFVCAMKLFVRMRWEVDRIIEREGAFWTDQFHNTDALTGYADLGREIVQQAQGSGVTVDVFVRPSAPPACSPAFLRRCRRPAGYAQSLSSRTPRRC